MGFAKTAGSIISDMRDLHGAFGSADAPNVLCRRFLSRYQRNLAAKIYNVAPSYFGQLGTNVVADAVLAIPATQAAFDAGIQIIAAPAADIFLVREVYGQRTDDASQTGQDKIEVIPRLRRGGINNRFPFVWIDGIYLFPGGRVEDWVAYASIKVRYTVVPSDLSADGTKIALQDDAADVMLAALAQFVAARITSLPGRLPIDLGYFKGEADKAEAEYLERVALGNRGQSERIMEVW